MGSLLFKECSEFVGFSKSTFPILSLWSSPVSLFVPKTLLFSLKQKKSLSTMQDYYLYCV